jgi:hypothetical protein
MIWQTTTQKTLQNQKIQFWGTVKQQWLRLTYLLLSAVHFVSAPGTLHVLPTALRQIDTYHLSRASLPQ